MPDLVKTRIKPLQGHLALRVCDVILAMIPAVILVVIPIMILIMIPTQFLETTNRQGELPLYK